MKKLFDIRPKKKRRGALNDLQRAQLQDCAAAGATIKIGGGGSQKKGWQDTPLFQPLIESNQSKLF